MKDQKLRKMVLCAALVALFVVLGRFSLNLKVFKLTFSSLPVVVAGLTFGPVYGAVVGLLGEFLGQMIGEYGLMITTPMWMLPVGLRGFLVGLYSQKHGFVLTYRQTVLCMILSSTAVSLVNTPLIYLDSKIYGYYSFAAVFGGTIARFVTGIAVAAILSTVAYPVARALRLQLSSPNVGE